MAAELINMWKAKHIVMVFGTAYHVSETGEDWETIVAEKVNADKIGGQEWVQVDDIVFDLKHFTTSSSTPYTFGAGLAKTWMWNLVHGTRDEQPQADIFLRGHVHCFNYVGNDSFLAMSLPALQGLGSKFGSRIPERRVDFGCVYFDVEGNKYTWNTDIVTVDEQKPIVTKY